ncbi:hypothetical protein F0562_031421 [Nyssa sinensis]|uniref:AP2/ERF domain-containing protein n=1 Tax=Nyssa sinensis TaxID=561372 RepID=A0A5J5AUF4_9ASTE|nr:hypothetical protein F0562_031421 [Nyssa sinensis]
MYHQLASDLTPVDDSEDMVIYGLLRDAVSVGWTPFNSTEKEVKIEQRDETEMLSVTGPATPELVATPVKKAPAVVPPKGRHYRGVRQRPWGKFAGGDKGSGEERREGLAGDIRDG